jgi:hypothetical protein
MRRPAAFMPMRLLRLIEPFDHSEFVLAKIDGFRASRMSRVTAAGEWRATGASFREWGQMANDIGNAVRCQVGLLFNVQAAEQTAHPTIGPRRRPGTTSDRCTQNR